MGTDYVSVTGFPFADSDFLAADGLFLSFMLQFMQVLFGGMTLTFSLGSRLGVLRGLNYFFRRLLFKVFRTVGGMFSHYAAPVVAYSMRIISSSLAISRLRAKK